MAKWTMLAKRADFKALAERYGIDPVIARLIRNRDVVDEQEIEEYLYGNVAHMHDPFLLKNMDRAVDFLVSQVKQQKHIRVIGDYDVDGICAAYVLHKGLEACGAHVTVAIPHRMVDGYGLNGTLIEAAHEDGVSVIVTCDNGISALEEIKYAKKLGIDVVVTDHHSTRYTMVEDKKKELLPECVAIINPKQEEDTYPCKELCGAMVACKLVQAMYLKYEKDWEQDRDDYLEFAAFATICDMMTLQRENRIIVKHGLNSMKGTRNIGLRQLMLVNEIIPEQISAYHIGFVLGPCFNATGRLETAMKTIELLQCTKEKEAEQLALALKELNDIRKELTAQGVEQAKEMLRQPQYLNQPVLVVYLKDCHESVAGIIAGRIKELYHKPTFVLTKGEEGVKGSGRSIEGYSMFDEMVKLEHFFTKYGGHPMAAGLSMREEDIDEFREAVNISCTLTAEDLTKKIVIDVEVPIHHLSEGFIQQLQQLEPFGMGNRKPVFGMRKVRVITYKVYGKNRNVLKATVEDEWKQKIQMIYYGAVEELIAYLKQVGQTLKIAYYPTVNEYQGTKNIQITMTEYE